MNTSVETVLQIINLSLIVVGLLLVLLDGLCLICNL